MLVIIPLGILLIGAGLMATSLWPRFGALAGGFAITSATLALLSLLVLAWWVPLTATVSVWPASGATAQHLQLSVTWGDWVLGASLISLTLATLLTGLARPGGRRSAPRAAMLLLTFAGLGALWANNLLTVIVAWAGFDLVYFFTLILLTRGPGVQPQAVLHLTFNSLGTLLALAASFFPPSNFYYAVFITLAAIFRLGLFPLHLGWPIEANVRQGLGTLLRLIPATIALDAVANLASLGFAPEFVPWLTVFGSFTALLGAAQFWMSADARQGLTFVVIALSGLALLAGVWGGAVAQLGVLSIILALVLGGGLVFLAHGLDLHHRWTMLLQGVGVATLIGLPATAGFFGWHHLMRQLVLAGQPLAWLALGGVFFTLVLLGAGLWRCIFSAGEAVEGGPVGSSGYLSGLSFLVLMTVALGVAWNSVAEAVAQPLTGWLGLEAPSEWGVLVALLCAIGLSMALWRWEGLLRVRGSAEGISMAVQRLFQLNWLYRLVWGLFSFIATLIDNLALVLEGEGALVWALVIALAVFLLFRS
ncbi:MAG: hypothetical protein JNL09_00530 [Anaerolineales bacterium]|nr:hypothetical protein [Anaerolineales bacterium]